MSVEAEEAGQEAEVADQGHDVHADLSAEGGGAARVSPGPRCVRNKYSGRGRSRRGCRHSQTSGKTTHRELSEGIPGPSFPMAVKLFYFECVSGVGAGGSGGGGGDGGTRGSGGRWG